MPRQLRYTTDALADLAAIRAWLTQPGSGPAAKQKLLAIRIDKSVAAAIPASTRPAHIGVCENWRAGADTEQCIRCTQTLAAVTQRAMCLSCVSSAQASPAPDASPSAPSPSFAKPARPL